MNFLSHIHKIKALIMKEFQIIWSDRKNRIMIILPPILQLTIFAYAATLEVKNISLLIYDKDQTEISRALIDKFENTPIIDKVYLINNQSQLKKLIDQQKVYLAVTIPNDFSKNIYNQSTATIQFILDGRKSNAAQIVQSYATQIVSNFQNEISGIMPSTSKIQINIRNWFNPNLDYHWFIVISLTGALAMVMTLSITALAVAQEKELGTFDQIIVSPLSSVDILIGKTIPALIITLLEVTFMLLAGIIIFNIPLEGSVFTLYTCILVFLLSIAGVGLFISTLCKTQQQAILGVFAFIAPTFLLSGYVTPVENMPIYLQKLSLINPLTYFFKLMKGIYLKNISSSIIFDYTLPLLGIAFITLTFAGWFFNKKLD